MIEEGKPAPTFTLQSDSGDAVALDSLRGKPVVLYFYPKDDTPSTYARSSPQAARGRGGARLLWVARSRVR